MFFLEIQQGITAPLSAPCACSCGCMCGNACVCGSGRTAAFVKMILSPRKTMTNGDETAEFANVRLDWKNHRQTMPDALCQTIYPSPFSCSHGFHPQHLQRLDRHYEKKSPGSGCTCSATVTSVQSDKTKIYSGLEPITVFCLVCCTATPSLGKTKKSHCIL